jgi:hypothetical protein
MATYTIVKRIYLSEAQAEAIKKLSRLPQFHYNDMPSENRVVRAALDLLLQQKSIKVDAQTEQVAS